MDQEKIRVLLLDDDPNLREVLSEILKVKGFEPIPVDTGAEALTRVEQQDTDVVLIDINLEDISGLEVLRGIKARSPGTECIMLTGHASQATAIEAVNLGAYSYFQKPYNIDHLILTIRRAAEKHASGHALLESEARFRSLIENSSDLIAIINTDATIRYVSPSIQRLLGYPSEEIIGGTELRDYIHPDDLPAFIEVFRKCIQSADSVPVSLQVRLLHKDGTWHTLDGMGRNLLTDPAVKGMIINARDISDRVRAEGERHALLEIMQGMVVTRDLQEFLQLIQHAVAKIIYAENFFVVFHNKSTGLFEEVFAMDKYDAPMPPSRLERSITSYVFRTGKPLLLTEAGFNELQARGEVELVGTKVGIWLGVPLQTPSETIGVMAVQSYEDPDCYSEQDKEFFASVGVQVALAIERKQTEEETKESGARYRSLFENSPISLWEEDFSGVKLQLDLLRKRGVKDFDKYLRSHPQFVKKCAELVRILDVNKATLQLYRTESKETLLKNLTLIFNDESYAQFREELIKIEKGQTQFSWEGINKALDGSRLDVKLSYAVAPERESDLSKVIISIVDVTERKRAENEISRMAERWEIVYRADDDIGASLDMEHVFEAVYHAVQQVMPCDDFVISLYDEARNEMGGEYILEQGKKVPSDPYLADRGLGGYIVHSGRSLLLNNPQQIQASGIIFIPFGSGQVTASVVGVPMLLKGKVIGVLSAQSYHLDAYAPADQELLEMLASHAAVSIDNARLFEQARQEIRERKQTQEALRKSESSLQAVLQSAADGILAVGTENDVLYTNDRFAELWRIPPEILENRDDSVLLQFVLDQLSDPQGFLLKIQELYNSSQESFDTLDFKDGRIFERMSQPLLQGAMIRGRVWSFRDITARVQADEARRQAEARYRSVVEAVPAIFYTEDLDHRAIFVSPKIEKLLGYTPEEWMGDSDFWKGTVHPDDLEKVLAEDARSNQGGDQFQMQYRTIRKDGRTIWLHDQATLVKDHGKPLFWQGVMYDITSEKESETALRISEERYRTLAENMSDTVWLMDMSLHTTYISPSVTRLRGFSVEEINTIPLDHQMPPDSLERALRLFAEILSPENSAQPGQPITRTIELEYYKKDGSRFWSENTFTLIYDAQAVPLAIMGVGRDISERKKVEASLLDSEKYFRALIENNTDAVVLLDPRGRILYESPAYGRMMGRSASQRIGKSGFEFIHPEDLNSVAQAITELVQHPAEIRRITYRTQHKDGSWRWQEATATNLLGESAIHALVINIHDVTDHKQAEEEIRRRVVELEVLYENGLAISVLLEPREIARKMVEILSQKLDWHHAAIRLYHPENKRLELLALSEPALDPDQIQKEIHRLNALFVSTKVGFSGWVVEHREPVRSGDVTQDKRYFSSFPDIRSGLYVPLMVGERPIGVISVESRQTNRFTDDDERLLQTLAAQSAIAFENARLFQEALSASKRKEALHQGGLEIVRAGQDIEALCLAIHYAARQVMPTEFFIISFITEDGLEVEAPYMYDRGIRHPNSRLPVEAGITGRVIKTGKSLRLKDVQRSKGPKPIMLNGAVPTRAVLSVPLLAREKIIGVISAQSWDPDVYSSEDQTFLETLGSEAAVAFENARLYQDVVRDGERRRLLYRAGQEIVAAGLNLELLYVSIHQAVSQLIPLDIFTIILGDEDRKTLHAVYLIDGGDRFPAFDFAWGTGLSGYVFRENKSLRIANYQEQTPVKSVLFGKPEVPCSILAVPLNSGAKIVGVLSVQDYRPNLYTEEDEMLLKTLAANAGNAIENSRLFESERRQHQLSDTLRNALGAGASLSSTLDFNEVLDRFLEAIEGILPCDGASIMILDHMAGEASVVRMKGKIFSSEEINRSFTGFRFNLGTTENLRWMAEHKQPLVIPDVTLYPGWVKIEGTEAIRSWAGAPIIVNSETIAFFSLSKNEADFYQPDHVSLLEAFAGQASLAFQNARLFEETRQRLAELESLSQVSVSLTSAIDLQPLIENILESAKKAIPAAEKGTILLAEPDGAFRLHAMSGYTDSHLLGLILPDKQGYVFRVARERIPIKIDDAQGEYEIPFKGTIEEIAGVQSGIAAPLIAKGRLIGVISLDNASRKAAFSDSDLRLLVTFASSAAVSIENARLFSETQLRLHRLTSLHSIDAAIGASVDTNVTLSIVLDHLVSDLGADAAAVLLLNPVTRMLEYSAGRGFRIHIIEGVRLQLGDGFAGQAALSRSPIRIPDLQNIEDVEQALGHPISASPSFHILEGEGFVSYFALPLIAKGQVQGVLEIFQRTRLPVDQEWISFFEMLAGQTAIAIDNGHLFENLQQTNLELTLAYDATIQGWSQALELRDEETEGHTRRVTDLTLRLMELMGIDEIETEHVRRGSLLHDIGKIAVPDSILLKAGPLDENEWKVMRQHPQYAYDLLYPIVYLRPAIHIPYCHHEKWDGSGYPRGLAGEAIPVVARIFAIVDVYDALTSDRPYRLAWTRVKAMEYIRGQSGIHFDPNVVMAFTALMAEK